MLSSAMYESAYLSTSLLTFAMPVILISATLLIIEWYLIEILI